MKTTNITTRLLELIFAVLVLVSCNKDENSTPGAFDSNAILSLSTITVDGFTTRAGNSAPANRIVVDGFVDGDVIQINYDFDGDYTTPEGQGQAYAKLSGSTWTLYTNIELTEVAKLQPNPNRPEESWEKLDLGFNFSPLGIVTNADGKKEYGGNEIRNPETGIETYYDNLTAGIRSTTPGTLKTQEYSIGTKGQISVCFAHTKALLSLPKSAITVGSYPEGYNGISALTGIIEFDDLKGNIVEFTIAFTLTPGTEPGKDTWQAITSISDKTSSITLKSLTATLAKDGTPGTPADNVTLPTTFVADDKPVALQSSTRYTLNLLLTPAHSNATITDAIKGWGDEEKLETTGIEGTDYTLAKAGDKTSDWTILTARGLATFRDYINSLNPAIVTHPNATLANNINLSTVCSQVLGKSWTPIGKPEVQYNGTFNGAGYTVSELYINHTLTVKDQSYYFSGLFGFLLNATVKNMTVKGSITIAGTNGRDNLDINIGGIVSSAENSTLTECHSTVSICYEGDGAVRYTAVYAGGIVGIMRDKSLSNCSSSGAVTAIVNNVDGQSTIVVGGICGHISETHLTGCSHTNGTISATTTKGVVYAGGVVGEAFNTKGAQLLGCTNTAEVKGLAGERLDIGGVAGNSFSETVACSNSGAITYNSKGDVSVGGVVGCSCNTVVASFSTTIPKISAGGSAGSPSRIGGVMGAILSTVDNIPYPVNACFYVNDIDLGSNGIGNGIGDGQNNANGGRVANFAELNSKVDGMNTAITTYNTTTTGTAKPCSYSWAASTTGGAPKLSK